MIYSVLNGGKRLRPLLVYMTGEILGAPLEALDIPACAIEQIHSFSLIHDDLPALDNDDLRRGKPSCHKAFDEAIAILAGDALQPLAFDVLSSQTPLLTAEQQIKMIQTLSKACRKMVIGQALDIANPQQPSEETFTHINQAKTGALIEASVNLGAITANCKDELTLNALSQYAQYVGLAFQIHDDIADFEKPSKKNEKITYPALIGIENAKQKVRELHDLAIQQLKTVNLDDSYLSDFAGYVANRPH